MIRFRFCFCARFGRWAAAVCAGRDMILPPWRRMRRTETRRRAFAPVGMYLLGYRAKRRKTAVNALQRYAADDMRMRSGLCALSGDAQRVQDRRGRGRAGIRSAGAARARWKLSRDLGKTKARRAGGRGVICNAWTCRTGRRTAAGAAGRYNTCNHLQCYCIISGRSCQGYLCGFRLISIAAQAINSAGIAATYAANISGCQISMCQPSSSSSSSSSSSRSSSTSAIHSPRR